MCTYLIISLYYFHFIAFTFQSLLLGKRDSQVFVKNQYEISSTAHKRNKHWWETIDYWGDKFIRCCIHFNCKSRNRKPDKRLRSTWRAWPKRAWFLDSMYTRSVMPSKTSFRYAAVEASHGLPWQHRYSLAPTRSPVWHLPHTHLRINNNKNINQPQAVFVLASHILTLPTKLISLG